MKEMDERNEKRKDIDWEKNIRLNYGDHWFDVPDYSANPEAWPVEEDDEEERDEDVRPEGMSEEEYDFRKEIVYLDSVIGSPDLHRDLMLDGYDDEDYYWLGGRNILRERMYYRGFSNLKPQEQLEMILFFVAPKADMKVLTRKILDRFGNVNNVLNARLEQFEGLNIPRTCKVWLLQVGRLVRRYLKYDRSKIKPVFCYGDLMEFVSGIRDQHPWPQTCMLYADFEYVVMACDKISDSTHWMDTEITRHIIKNVVALEARYAYMVIFCGPDPVELDELEKKALVSLAMTLKALRMELLDCLIVSDFGFFSVVRDGKFDILRREEEWRRTKKNMLYNFTEAKDEI